MLRKDSFYVPPMVNPRLLKANGKLLDDQKIAELVEEFKDKSVGRYSKAVTGGQYGIVKGNDGLYLVYRDLESKDNAQFELGKGSFGAAKLVEGVWPPAVVGWYVMKSQKKHPQLGLAISVAELKVCTQLELADSANILRSSKKTDMLKHHLIVPYFKGDNLLKLVKGAQDRRVDLATWPPLLWLELINKILAVVDGLHKKGFLHRDIKLENMIFDFVTGKLELIDFGFALNTGAALTAVQAMRCGTKPYAAPELFVKAATYEYSVKTEIYALGQTLKSILQRVPCLQNDVFLQRSKVVDFKVVDFVESLLVLDPAKRPKMEAVTAYFSELTAGYLQQNPHARSALQKLQAEAQAKEAQRLQCAEQYWQCQLALKSALSRYEHHQQQYLGITKFFATSESAAKKVELEGYLKSADIQAMQRVAGDYIRDHSERELAKQLKEAGFTATLRRK